MANILLEVKNLSKHYSNKKGIDDISFTLSEGEILGFIGPNGAGKSTTIKTIIKLLKKDSGTISFFGRSLDKNFENIMQFVGYLPSDEVAYENMTAKAFLKFAASFYEIDYSDNIISLANRLDLNLNQRIKEMSLGNKKKVGLIGAVFHEPKIIILDEPTSGLDPLAQLEFIKILKEFKGKGCGIFLSSHVLSEVQNLCDNILIIKKGVIIKQLVISELANTHKKVFLTLDKEIDKNKVAIPNIKNLEVEGKKVSFLYVGDVSQLIKKLNAFEIVDITIENPSLEELFLHYYD